MKPEATPITRFSDQHRPWTDDTGGRSSALGCPKRFCFRAVGVQDLESSFLHRLQEEMANLRPQDREMLLLCAGSLRYEEIATALSIPVASVRERVVRVREQLRPRLFANPGIAGLSAAQIASKARAWFGLGNRRPAEQP